MSAPSSELPAVNPPFRVVLVEPDIPHNTGAAARLCAATGSELHLVEPLGFRITDARVKRAGLDYWEHVAITRHASLTAFLENSPGRMHLFTTKADTPYTADAFEPGDAFLFGCETRGLPESLLAAYPDRLRAIPMRRDHVRSLNLSTSVAIVLFEAFRQLQAAHSNH